MLTLLLEYAMKMLEKTVFFASVMCVLCLVTVHVNAAGNAADGGTAYTQSCASCHGEKPTKMMGQPTVGLQAKLVAFRTKPNLSGKSLQMQEVVKSLPDQTLENIASYLNGLK